MSEGEIRNSYISIEFLIKVLNGNIEQSKEFHDDTAVGVYENLINWLSDIRDEQPTVLPCGCSMQCCPRSGRTEL